SAPSSLARSARACCVLSVEPYQPLLNSKSATGSKLSGERLAFVTKTGFACGGCVVDVSGRVPAAHPPSSSRKLMRTRGRIRYRDVTTPSSVADGTPGL